MKTTTIESNELLVRAFLEISERRKTELEERVPQTPQVSEKFKKKMTKLIEDQQKPLWKYVNTALKKTAVAMLAVVILFTASLSISAIREPIFRYAKEVYEIFVELTSPEEANADVPAKIQEIYMPSYVPQGYTQTRYKVSANDVLTEWSNGENTVQLVQDVRKNSVITLDTENSDYTVYEYAGFEIHRRSRYGVYTFCWGNDRYEFYLSCPEELGIEGAEKMIESISIVDKQ